MLEGKELEGKVGKFGKYELDVKADGTATVKFELNIDIVAELEVLAARSDNKIDDGIISIVKKALGRD